MRLFVTRRLPVDASRLVGPGLEVEIFRHDRAPTREELLEGAAGAAGLVTLLCDSVDADLLERLPDLRVVANVAAGLDNIDRAAAAARGVRVCHTPDVVTEATAELTWALLLALARRLREGERLVREGRFVGWSPTLLLGRELRGTVLGILGFGRIGQAVARRAGAFGMEVRFTTRSPVPTPVAAALGATEVPWEELLETADFLSLHCPLTAATRQLVGAAELARMRRGAFLVNTARGPVVDEAALVAALQSGHLGGAGLDVYEEEPRVHPGLLDRDDVVLLPHVGSATLQTRRAMAEMALGDAVRVLRGEAPRYPAPDPAP